MARYANTRVTTHEKGRNKKRNSEFQKYNTTIYHKIPERNDDLLVVTQEGDRLDNLAFQFYGNPHLWWYIAHANGLSSMNVEGGLQIRIPSNTMYARGD